MVESGLMVWPFKVSRAKVMRSLSWFSWGFVQPCSLGNEGNERVYKLPVGELSSARRFLSKMQQVLGARS